MWQFSNTRSPIRRKVVFFFFVISWTSHALLNLVGNTEEASYVGHFMPVGARARAKLQHSPYTFSVKQYLITVRTSVFQILANNQLDALFCVFIYFISLHVSSITLLIIRRSNCSNTSSGMISLCKWLLRMPVGIPSSHLHRLIIPDDVLKQFDLLMMSTVMLETCREMK